MKRVLLITGGFPPDFSPRMGYLCKWLSENSEWRMVVVKYGRDPNEKYYPQSFGHLVGYAEQEYSFVPDDGIHGLSLRAVLAQMMFRKLPIKTSVQMIMSKIRYAICGSSFDFSVKAAIRKGLKTGPFNIILCSLSTGNLHRAGEFARRISGLPIVYDVRDIDEEQVNLIMNRKSKRRIKERTKAFGKASHVAVVVDRIGMELQKHDPSIKYEVIPNGFDPESFYPVEAIRNEQFEIVYVGNMYFSLYERRFRDFLEAIEGLTKRIDGTKLKISFYITRRMFEEEVLPRVPEHLKAYFCWRNSVENDKLLGIFARSQICLLFGRDMKDSVDGISSKTFEYLASNRPILILGNPDWHLQPRTINEAHAGCVADSAAEAETFLYEKYLEWQETGRTVGRTDWQLVAKFSRAEESKRFMEIFDDIVLKRSKTNIEYNNYR